MVGEFLKLAHQMHEESQFRNRSFSDKKVRKLLENPNAFWKLEYIGNEAVGFILGTVHEQFFGNDVVANDLSLYVLPEHRGKRVAIRLIKAFEEWARQRGAKDVYLGISTGINPERTAKFYGKLGYTQVGNLTKKEL